MFCFFMNHYTLTSCGLRVYNTVLNCTGHLFVSNLLKVLDSVRFLAGKFLVWECMYLESGFIFRYLMISNIRKQLLNKLSPLSC